MSKCALKIILNNSNTLFLVFDGPDVSGKTSLITALKDRLEKENYQVFLTREPGQVLGNLDFRKLFFTEKRPNWSDPLLDVLFFVADRRINLKQIKKWTDLKSVQKKVIICDRYFYSTFVYQGYLCGVPFPQIKALHELMGAWKVPDLVFFFSNKNDVQLVDPDHYVQRPDRFEQMSISTSAKTYDFYRKTAKYFITEQKHPILFLDIGDPFESKVASVMVKIREHFAK